MRSLVCRTRLSPWVMLAMLNDTMRGPAPLAVSGNAIRRREPRSTRRCEKDFGHFDHRTIHWHEHSMAVAYAKFCHGGRCESFVFLGAFPIRCVCWMFHPTHTIGFTRSNGTLRQLFTRTPDH